MNPPIAALPMYDWPEARAEVDAEWARLRDALAGEGIAAPARLVRRNADMQAVPGGIRDAAGRTIAPDPATLPPQALDLSTLWRHPRLLLAQTCWGPMEAGLKDQVQWVGQPDYSAHEGGAGGLYSSAILMRRGAAASVAAPEDGRAVIEPELLRGKRLAFNERLSMSGFLALERDLKALGAGLSLFSQTVETGGHRASARAVAAGEADLCAVDCRTWSLLRRFEPASAELAVVGWTALRPGLPFITSRLTDPRHVAVLRRVLSAQH